MAQKKYEIVEYPYGVCTDPNVIKAPQGALDTCDNAVIRRDGIAEPMEGLDYFDTTDSNMSSANRGIYFDGDAILFKPGTDEAEWIGDLGTYVLNEDGNGAVMYPEHIRGVISRDNLYVTTAEGVKKLYSSSDTELTYVGCRFTGAIDLINCLTTVTSYNFWFETGNTVAYRVTLVKEDDNGLIIESAPTCSIHKTADGSGPYYNLVRVQLMGSASLGDKLRIFRTRQYATAVGPGDTFYLLAEITITASHISSQYVDHNDVTSDDSLGESMYTNATQQGIAQQNDVPMIAKEIAFFNGSMFYANLTSTFMATFTMQNWDSDLAGVTTGAGSRQLTGDFTNGDPDILNVSDTSGLEIGQKIYAAGYATSTDLYIASISGSTVTMTGNASATGVTKTVFFHDVIFVGTGSTNYEITWASSSQSTTHNFWQISRHSADNNSDYYFTTTGHTESGVVSTQDSNRVTVHTTIKSGYYFNNSFSVWATQGDSYEPALNGPSSWDTDHFVLPTANLDAEQETYPDWIMWSKNNQPEHVPFSNSKAIGDRKDIYRLISTKDSLFIFAESGIHKCKGYSADSGWTFDQLDLSEKILRPDAACVADGTVFALTENGLVTVSDAGVDKVSRFFIHEELKLGCNTLHSNKTTDTLGCWLTYSDKHNELLISLPPTIGSSSVTSLWIYNTITERFYRRNPNDGSDFWHAFQYDSDSLYMYYILDDVPNFGSYFAFSENGVTGANCTRTKTVSAKPDSTTVDFSSSHEATAGDIIVQGSNEFVIVTKVDANTVTVADNTNLSLASCTIYTPVDSTIIWLPKFGETRVLRKHFYHGSFIFQALDGLDEYQYTLDGGSNYSSTTAIPDTTCRYVVPIANSRKLMLTPGIKISGIDEAWELAGMSLEYKAQAPRGVKK